MRLIDAEAFFEEEFKRCGSAPLVGTCTSDNEYLSERLKKAPTIEATPVVHAHWEPKKIMARTPFARNYYCSNCKDEPLECKHICGNCGAQMDEEINDDQ